jgi:cytoskeletal protein CcmA (bactofilin family)
MAKKTELFHTSGSETVIGSGVKLRGNLSSEGDITVDGRMVGNIKSGGSVTIGVNAQVVGDVNGTSVTVGGHLNGSVKALDATTIVSTGAVHGDITTTRLEIAMGGVFIGTSKMKAAEATEIFDRTDLEETKR